MTDGMKELSMEDQERAERATMKEKAMEHLVASCTRAECLRLISKAYQKIEYFDAISMMLPAIAKN